MRTADALLLGRFCLARFGAATDPVRCQVGRVSGGCFAVTMIGVVAECEGSGVCCACD